jgi:hypothetical protein
MRWILAVAGLALAACDRQPAVTSCDDALLGVWIAPGGSRWMILDYGATLEAFPLFDDAVADGAPRLIDLRRTDKLAGEVKRRYRDRCEAHAPIRVAKCKADTLQVVLADPQPPLQDAPCTWGQVAPSRVEHWRRE